MSADLPRVVLLDLDGTLSDNYSGISASIRHALASLGTTLSEDTCLRHCVGPPLRESLAQLLATEQPAKVEAALVAYRKRYGEVGWRENVVYDGVPEMLAALARCARIFVCTSKPAVFANRIVKHFGLGTHVERVYGTDLEGRLDDKSTLVAHLLASEQLRPKMCTMVGDRHHDIRAARANGARAIGALWGYGSARELADADALAPTPRDLPAVLAALDAIAG